MRRTAIVTERRPVRTIVRFAKLVSVLGSHFDRALHEHVARLSVLFEDLRIEITGLVSEDLGNLNDVPKNSRLIYFLRRSLATLHEFSEELRLLDRAPEFAPIRGKMDGLTSRHWRRAIAFFEKYENKIARIRHHVGGHFGLDAAKQAVQHLKPDASASMEIQLFSDNLGGATLGFAGEVAATALLWNVKGQDSDRRARRLMRIARVGYKHAINAVNCISVHYLWELFGR